MERNAPVQTTNQCGRRATIANPYYHYAEQALLDRNGWYDAYANNPPQSAPDTVTQTAINPNVFAGFLNYKHDKFTASINMLLNEGNTYGSPLAVTGLDPRDCFGNQGHTVPGLKGSPTGAFANYQYCTASTFAPSGYLVNPESANRYVRRSCELSRTVAAQHGHAVRLRRDAPGARGRHAGEHPQRVLRRNADAVDGRIQAEQHRVCVRSQRLLLPRQSPGAGFFYGNNPHAPQNGTAGYPAVFNQSYQPLYNSIPFQVYFQAQVKL